MEKTDDSRKKVIAFCRKQEDISTVFVAQIGGRQELILVVDDVTDENVLLYNEFGFELRKRYNAIYGFRFQYGKQYYKYVSKNRKNI